MDLILTEPLLTIGRTSRRIQIRRKGKVVKEIPVDGLSSITVASRAVSVSSDALWICARRGIAMNFLSGTGDLYARLISAKDFGDAELRHKQILARGNSLGVNILVSLIKCKMVNQEGNLKYFLRSRKETPSAERLLNAIEAIESQKTQLSEADLSNPIEKPAEFIQAREAQASKHYWEGVRTILPDKYVFLKRVRKGAEDPFNVMLNYGYGILYAQVWSAVMASGLDPYAGLMHSLERGRPSFVYDFIEPFRQPIVDRPLLAWATKGGMPEFQDTRHMKVDSKRQVARLVLERLEGTEQYKGQNIKIKYLLRNHAFEVARLLRGEIEAYRGYVAKW